MIGNIVDISNKTKYDEIFNKVDSIELCDNQLPTLIIGIDNAKQNIDGFNILQKQYNNDIFWTFTKKERRREHIDDLLAFKKYCIEHSLKAFRYEYLNFQCFTFSKFKKFVRYINSDDKKLCFLTKNSNFLFIYSRKHNIEWGLSLTFCEYIGVDRHKVIKRIKDNKHNKFVYDITLIDNDTRAIIGNNTHYILPLYDKLTI